MDGRGRRPILGGLRDDQPTAVRIALYLGSILIVAGCGSRSALPIDDLAVIGGAPGVGGTSGSGGSGSGGTPDAGPPPAPPCNELTPSVPIATLDPDAVGHDTHPQLVRTDTDDVTVVFTRETVAGVELRHGSLLPWTFLTHSIAPTHATVPGSFPSLTFAAGTGAAKKFPVLVGSSNGVTFSTSVNAWGSGDTPDKAIPGSEAVFVANGDVGPLVGTREDNDMLASLGIANENEVTKIACGTSPTVADGEAVGDEWLVAFSTGTPQDEFCLEGVPLGEPQRIDVHRVVCAPGLCLSVSSQTSIDVGATIESLVTARHSDGLWVVWKSSKNGERRVEWARFSESTGDVLRGDISHAGDAPLEIAADALGDSLVVVWADAPAIGPPVVNITVLNDQGSVTASTSIGPPFSGPISVVASPYANALSVAWSEGSPARIQLERFRCL